MKVILILFNLFQIIISIKDLAKKGFGTKIVHGGYHPDPITGNIIPSITLGTTFSQDLPGLKPGKEDANSHGTGYFYSRQANPTRGTLERSLALVENGKHCAVFSSGMAAISTVFQLLKSGDHVVSLNDLYGGTFTYFKDIATERNGINITYLDMLDYDKLEKSINSNTKLIYLE